MPVEAFRSYSPMNYDPAQDNTPQGGTPSTVPPPGTAAAGSVMDHGDDSNPFDFEAEQQAALKLFPGEGEGSAASSSASQWATSGPASNQEEENDVDGSLFGSRPGAPADAAHG